MEHKILPKVRGQYKLNYNLAHLTWFKVGGPADVLFKPEDTDDLVFFLSQNQNKLPLTVLGAGSNIIIRDKGVEGVVIKLGRNFTSIEIDDKGRLVVGAGCLNYNLAKFCRDNSIKGLEFLVGIPGTIGGGIAMNAGSYGSEFRDIVVEVEAVDYDGKIKRFTNSEMGFSYRKNTLPDNLIFTKVIFKAETGNKEQITDRMREINEARSATQPITEKTGGSTFANPDGKKSWELIDGAGLRGKRIGGASMSNLHCNFMINHGDASATDIEELGEYVRSEVKKHYGVNLHWEIKRIGRND
jgi:UDP-N-acetylmuramate dehydrogenase